MNIIKDKSYISARQRKALSNDEIAFIQQMEIEDQQQEQETHKWERQVEQSKDTTTTTTTMEDKKKCVPLVKTNCVLEY